MNDLKFSDVSLLAIRGGIVREFWSTGDRRRTEQRHRGRGPSRLR